MNNFIFKSANRLTKNSSINLGILDRRLEFIQAEMRHQRSDLKDISLKLEKLLINKHLDFQVEDYYAVQDRTNEDAEPD